GPRLSCHRLQTRADPFLGLLPSLSRHGDGLTTLLGLEKLRFHGQTHLSALLFPDQLTHIFAGGAVTTLVNLPMHPLLECRGQRDVHACSHRLKDTLSPSSVSNCDTNGLNFRLLLGR